MMNVDRWPWWHPYRAWSRHLQQHERSCYVQYCGPCTAEQTGTPHAAYPFPFRMWQGPAAVSGNRFGGPPSLGRPGTLVHSPIEQLQRADEIRHRVATSLSLQHIQIHEPSFQVRVYHGDVRQELKRRV